MKFSPYICLISALKYIKADVEVSPETWEVGSFLSSNEMPEFLFNSDSPTSDPAYWFDWKDVVTSTIKDRLNNEIDSEVKLTLEQGLKSIEIFLSQKYWEKNNEMLLIDAYKDLAAEYERSKDNIFDSNLWKEWLEAVKEGLKFDKTFKET